MKKAIFTTIFLSLVLVGWSQHGRTPNVPAAPVRSHAEFMSNGERFWLYLNNRSYTKKSENVVKIPNLDAETIYDVRIVMDNPRREEIRENLCIRSEGGTVQFVISRGRNPHGSYQLWVDNNLIHADQYSYSHVCQHVVIQTHSEVKRLPSAPHGHGQQPQVPTPPAPPAPHDQGQQPQDPVPPVSTACPDAHFHTILASVKSQKFESDKLMVAKRAAAGERFTCAQLTELTRAFSYDTDRVDFLKYAYDFCFDPQHYYLTYSALSYSSSKEEVEKYIQRR